MIKRIRPYLPSESMIQKAFIVGSIFVESYSVVVGSYFSVFVPQLCYNHQKLYLNNTHPQICTITDNLFRISPFNQAVLACNTVTALLFLATFIYECYRENWVKNHFFIDRTKAMDHIYTEFEQFPVIKEKLKLINGHYSMLIGAAIGMSQFNIAISLAMVNEYQNGFQTYTTFFTNTVVIITRIYHTMYVLHHGQYDVSVKSIFTVPTQYNRIKN